MKELLNFIENIIDNAKDRLKNPIIGAFATSWIIINWKPIYYILFSSSNAETIIDYVTTRFSDWKFIYLYPSVLSLFYLLALPYINWWFENLVEKSNTERNNNLRNKRVSEISNEGDVLVAETIRDQRKTDALKASDNRATIEGLQSQVEQITKMYTEEKTRNIENRNKSLREIEELTIQNNAVIDELNQQHETLKANLLESGEFTGSLMKRLEVLSHNAALEKQTGYKLFIQLKSQSKHPQITVLKNNMRILEYIDPENNACFLDLSTGNLVDSFKIYENYPNFEGFGITYHNNVTNTREALDEIEKRKINTKSYAF